MYTLQYTKTYIHTQPHTHTQQMHSFLILILTPKSEARLCTTVEVS